MGETLALSVPETTTTRFLIATDDESAPGIQRLGDLLPAEGLARIARDLLASPLLLVTGCSAADSPWTSRLRGLGGGEGELAALRSARRHLVVTSIAAPAAQPRQAQAARLVARTLAAATGGRVADLAANQVLGDPTGPEPDRFLLCDGWLGLFLTPGEGRTMRADTAGLHRFGLPELVACQIPYGRMLTAVTVLRGLAARLLAEHRTWLSVDPVAAVWRVPVDLSLHPDDILRYWGVHHPGLGGPIPLRLTICSTGCLDCDTGLRLTPPGDRPEPEWWERTAAPAIPTSLRAAVHGRSP